MAHHGLKIHKFLSGTISDFINIYLRHGSKVGTGYAFIVHPRGYGDIVGNLPFLKIFPRAFVLKLFHLLWPFTVSGIYGLKNKNGEELRGWVIGVPLLPHQIMENKARARHKIAQAVKLARNKGAMVVGLGALTGSVTEGGAGLTKDDGVIITAGRAYTSFVIKSYADDAVEKFGLQKSGITIAIVGAAGGVGRAVVRLIAAENYKKIILIDLERKLDRIHQVLSEAESKGVEVEVTHQIGRVKEADIIITVTNAPEAVVKSDDIKPGAIIIDDAQPSDISPEVIKNRDDVIIIEAGVISADTIKVGTNFRLANRNETYCCLGEAMCIASSGWEGEYKPGEITPDLVAQISDIAKQIGFKLGKYQYFGKVITEERLERVKEILKQKQYND